MYIPLGEWKPDVSNVGADTLTRAYQLYADGDRYNSLKEWIAATEPLPHNPLGSASFVDRDGNITTIAGDNKNLYVSRGYSWEKISKVDDGYNSDGQIWRFVMWGNYIFATNYNDPIQAWEIGSNNKCFDMAENAPRCKDFAIVNEFLVLVNCVDRYDGETPDRVWWSPIGNPFGDWTPNTTTMCDYQPLAVGNYCVGIVGGSHGIILMRSALLRMTFSGASTVFNIDVVEKDKGCVGIEAFCNDGDDIYFVSQEGFYFWNGSQAINISNNKIEKWFFDNSELRAANIIISVFDKVRKIVMFGYPGRGQYEKTDKMLIYGLLAQKWTEAECPFTHFTQFLSKGYTLEELDQISTSIDNLPFSLDSNYYKGGVPYVGGFGEDGIFYFEGENNLKGTITTGNIALISNEQRSYTQRIRPIINKGEKHTLSICGKQSIFEEDNFGRICSLTSIGDFTERKSGRYHKFKFEFGGQWSNAQGFEVSFVREGQR